MIKEYRTIEEISGSLMLVRQVAGVKCGELGEIELPAGEIRLGEVLEVSESNAIVQLFGSGEGISPASGKIKFSGRSLELGVSPDMLGRIFSGMGEPIDRIPKILPKRTLNINGSPINPAARKSPSEFIQTGISAIDGLNPLIRGQKLSVFSGYGLPHAELAAQIARQAKVLSSDAGFAVVFGAIGVTFEEADFFISDFRNSGVIDRTVMFINLASDPVTERNATPRMALTAAEYLAFEENMHVLVILTDIANYSEGLENLASVFERAGEKTGREGSVTIIPILSVPDYGDAVRHITEGQIVLSRDFYRKGCLPPVDILHSLSHLKDKGIGSGKTREDHADMSNQLLVCYSRGCEVRNLKSALTKNEILYAKFADSFEEKYINQSFSEERTIEQTLGLGWELLSALPKSEMKRIRPDIIEKYWRR